METDVQHVFTNYAGAMQIPVSIVLLILITLSMATLWFFLRKRRGPTY